MAKHKPSQPTRAGGRRRSRGPLLGSSPSRGTQPTGAAAGVVGPGQGLAFFPDPSAFLPQTMDVLTGNGGLPPPGPVRYAALSISITGVWLEGHRTKVSNKDAYTHLILADPTLALYDSYNYQGRSSGSDALAIPAGQTNNYWLVVLSFVSLIPGFGRRLVIAADRFGTPGSWPSLV